ncbi:hypothetical protein FQZ97_956040 [compost metagenome]
MTVASASIKAPKMPVKPNSTAAICAMTRALRRVVQGQDSVRSEAIMAVSLYEMRARLFAASLRVGPDKSWGFAWHRRCAGAYEAAALVCSTLSSAAWFAGVLKLDYRPPPAWGGGRYL